MTISEFLQMSKDEQCGITLHNGIHIGYRDEDLHRVNLYKIFDFYVELSCFGILGDTLVITEVNAVPFTAMLPEYRSENKISSLF